MATELLEEGGIVGEPTGKRWKVRLISGDTLGSSGYYPAETLRRDGPRLFVKGTPMFIDHQTAEERQNKPFGSIDTFAGELAEDAYYDNDGLYADVDVFDWHAPKIKALASRIGISIRAQGRTVSEMVGGKSVPVVKELLKARSADFVMKAGAGGKLVQILESATDTENLSETEKEGKVMDEATRELLEGLKASSDAQTAALTALATALTPKPVEHEETAFEVNSLEVAKELAKAELSEQATERVLERFEANKGTKTLAELIESEKAYLSANKTAETEGLEESEREQLELEEAAKNLSTETFTLPTRWTIKDKK